MCIVTSAEHHLDSIEPPAERILKLVDQQAISNSNESRLSEYGTNKLLRRCNSERIVNTPNTNKPNGFNLTKCLSEPDCSEPRERRSSFPWKLITDFCRPKSNRPKSLLPLPRSKIVGLDKSPESISFQKGSDCPYQDLKIRWRRQHIINQQKIEAESFSWFDRLVKCGFSVKHRECVDSNRFGGPRDCRIPRNVHAKS